MTEDIITYPLDGQTVELIKGKRLTKTLLTPRELRLWNDGIYYPFQYRSSTLKLQDERIISIAEYYRQPLKVQVEQTLPEYFYFASVSDLVVLLKEVFGEEVNFYNIMFKQPKTGFNPLQCCWATDRTWRNSCRRGRGRTVYVYAHRIDSYRIKSRGLSIWHRKELKRLELDGHAVKFVGRDVIITTNPSAARCTHLRHFLAAVKGLFNIQKVYGYQQGRLSEQQQLDRASGYTRKTIKELKRRKVYPYQRIDDDISESFYKD